MCIRLVIQFMVHTLNFNVINDYSINMIIVAEQTITKDNPAFSMINESDEEVVFGSEDESRPLNSTGGGKRDYDSD